LGQERVGLGAGLFNSHSGEIIRNF
jgi:hypothetical protein